MWPRSLLIAAAMSLLAPILHADGFALSAKAGSTGIGAEATIRLTDRLNARIGGAAFRYNHDSQLSDVDYALGAPRSR